MSPLENKISKLTPASLRLLARLAAEGNINEDNHEITPIEGNAGPLSPAQERLWYVEQLHPGSHAYHLPLILQVPDGISYETVRDAVSLLSQRHEALRTRISIEASQLWQWVEDDALQCKQLSVNEIDEAHSALNAYLAEPFDFGQALTRCTLFTHPGGNTLLLVIHHLLADGWSLQILSRELRSLLDAPNDEGLARLPDLPVRPHDVAAWQRRELTGQKQTQAMTFWDAMLEGAPKITSLPTDRPRLRIESRRGAAFNQRLKGELVTDLDKLALSLKTTRFPVLLAGFAALITALGGESDHVIGTPFARRDRPELRNIVTYLVEMLPLRIQAKENLTLTQLVKQISETMANAVAHSDLPLQELVGRHAGTRSLALSPLFQVVFAYQDLGGESSDTPTPPAPETVTDCDAKFELCLSLRSAGSQALDSNWEYRQSIFDAETIKLWADHYTSLLRAWLSAPEQTLKQIIKNLQAHERPPATATIPSPIFLKDGHGQKSPAANNCLSVSKHSAEWEKLSALLPELRDTLAGKRDSSQLAFGLSTAALQACASAWTARLNLKPGLKVSYCDDDEARVLAATLAIAHLGKLVDSDAESDLFITRPGFPPRLSAPTITIAWQASATRQLSLTDGGDAEHTHCLTWPLASGCAWSVEATFFTGRPQWPTARPLAPQFSASIKRRGMPVLSGGIGQLQPCGPFKNSRPKNIPAPWARLLPDERIQLITPQRGITVRNLRTWPEVLGDWLRGQESLRTANWSYRKGELKLALNQSKQFDALSLDHVIGDRLGEEFRPTSITISGTVQVNSDQDDPSLHDAITAVVWRIWRELLGQPGLGLDHDFFEAGGTSIIALDLLARLQSVLGVNVPLHTIFEAPTARTMSSAVSKLCAEHKLKLSAHDSPEASELERIIASLDPDDVGIWCDTLDREQVSTLLNTLLAGAVSTDTLNPEILKRIVESAVRGGRLVPASLQQTRLWFAEQLQAQVSAAHHLPVLLSFPKAIDQACIELALKALIERHQALRTHFRLVGGELWQEVQANMPLEIRHEATQVSSAAELANEAFDLETGPLLRVHVFDNDNDKLLLVIHHAVVDGWSIRILREELFLAYQQAASGKIDLGPAPAQAPDFALQQKRSIINGDFEKAMKPWLKLLRETQADSPGPAWPSDRMRGDIASDKAIGSSWWIDKPTLDGLKSLASREQVSLFQVLALAIGILAHRLSGKSMLAIGSPLADRSSTEAQSAVAYLVDILPVFIDLRGTPSVKQALTRLRKTAKKLSPVPFSLLAKAAGQSGQRNRHAIVETSLSLQELSLLGTTVTPDVSDGSWAPCFSAFELDVTFVQTDDGRLRMIVATADDLFEHSTNELLARTLRNLLCELPGHQGAISKLLSAAPPAKPSAEPSPDLLDQLSQHARDRLLFHEEDDYARIHRQAKRLCTELAESGELSGEIDKAVPLVAAAQRLDASLSLDNNRVKVSLKKDRVPAARWVYGARELAINLGWNSRTLHASPQGDPEFVLSSLLALAWAGANILSGTADSLCGSPDAPQRQLHPGPSWRSADSALFLESCGGFAGPLACHDGGKLLWQARTDLPLAVIANDAVQTEGTLGTLSLWNGTEAVDTGLRGWIGPRKEVHLYGVSPRIIMTPNGPVNPDLACLFCREIPGVAAAYMDEEGLEIEAAEDWTLAPSGISKALSKALGAGYQQLTVNILGAEEAESPLATAPESALELAVARYWRDILGEECHDIDRNFFEAGGSSIEAVRLLSLLRERLDLDIELASFFSAATIRDIADHHLGEAETRASESQDSRQSRPQIRANPKLSQAPLSFAQERMWFLTQLFPQSTVHNMLMVIDFDPTISKSQVEQALEQLVQRHAVLRTRIVSIGGIPMQVSGKQNAVILPDRNGGKLPKTQHTAHLRERANQISKTVIDLREKTWHAEWLCLGESGNFLLLVIHHIISDGWSVNLLQRDLLAFCGVEGSAEELPALPFSYGDYCRWQRAWLSGAHGLAGDILAARVKRLRDAPALLTLPWDRPRPRHPTQTGATQQLAFDQALREHISSLSSSLGVTPFALVTAAFSVLLARWSGEHDIVLGTPSHQRNTVPGITDIVGLFVNTLALRIEVESEADFSTTVKNTAQELRQALAAEELPFEQLVSALGAARDIGYNPVFQVMIAWQDFGETDLKLVNFDNPAATITPTSAHFDLTLYIHPADFGYLAVMEYSTELFDHGTITRLFMQLRYLLETATQQPDLRVGALPLSAPQPPPPAPQFRPAGPCLTARLAAFAQHSPELPALEQDGQLLTYADLIQEAAGLAACLQKAGVRPGDRVAVYMQPCLNASLSMLAVFWLGASYVPIDPNYPDERCEYIYRDALPKAIIAAAPPSWHRNSACRWLNPASRNEPVPLFDAPLESELYLIYTSGSTGRPKGVRMLQGPIAALIDWQTSANRGSGMKTMQFAPLGFDVSIQEHLATWLSGGCLLTLDKKLRRDPELLIRQLIEAGAQRIFLPYVALQQLCSAANQRSLPAMREVITAGEQLRVTPSIRDFFIRHPQARLFNQYGPSETHVVTEYSLPAKPDDWPSLPPIGKAVAGAQICIMDDNRQLNPPGVLGEIWIGGYALADGYLNLAEETAARFVHLQDGSRWYRSGDYGRMDEKGLVNFVGRRDAQVKIRGFRVELGEIEAALSQLPGVNEAVLRTRRIHGVEQLVAYLCPEQAPEPSVIRKHLAEKLPDYMIPSHILRLPDLPKTASGKLARSQLPDPDNLIIDDKKPASRKNEDSPPLENFIAGLWTKTLGVTVNNPDLNFFELGGQSLLVMQFVVDLEGHVGFRAPPGLVFQHPRLCEFSSAFASHIGETLGELGPAYVERVQEITT